VSAAASLWSGACDRAWFGRVRARSRLFRISVRVRLRFEFFRSIVAVEKLHVHFCDRTFFGRPPAATSELSARKSCRKKIKTMHKWRRRRDFLTVFCHFLSRYNPPIPIIPLPLSDPLGCWQKEGDYGRKNTVVLSHLTAVMRRLDTLL